MADYNDLKSTIRRLTTVRYGVLDGLCRSLSPVFHLFEFYSHRSGANVRLMLRDHIIYQNKQKAAPPPKRFRDSNDMQLADSVRATATIEGSLLHDFRPTLELSIPKSQQFLSAAPQRLEDDARILAAIASDILDAGQASLSATLSLSHELANCIAGLQLSLRDVTELLEGSGSGEVKLRATRLLETCVAEAEIGFYLVRNYLSHFSGETLAGRRLERVDLEKILRQMLKIHCRIAAHKHVEIEYIETTPLPPIYGVEAELRRAFHNILMNAIKYSYHSVVPSTQRTIHVSTKVPYDPGFRRRRFAVSFESYGLGVSPDEIVHIGRPGFRGRQARQEHPIGSGLGLSEVRKIMHLHEGELNFSTKELHRDHTGQSTYLTRVELVFPYD